MFAILCALALLGEGSPAAAGESNDTMAALANGYRANLDRIRRGRARFEVFEGTAADIERARGNELERSVTSTGRYAFDGEVRLYERLYSEQTLLDYTKLVGDHEMSSPYISIRILTNGLDTLIDNIYVDIASKTIKHRPVIKRDAGELRAHLMFPFYLGINDIRSRNFALDCADLTDGTGRVKSVAVERGQYEGAEVFRVLFQLRSGDRTYWVDAQKGCIPRQVIDRDKNGKIAYIIKYDNVEQLGDQAWFPRIEVQYKTASRAAKVLRVLDFSTEVSADRSDFRLAFPEPVAIIDTVRSVRRERAREFALGDLANRPVGDINPVRIVRTPAPAKGSEMPGETTVWREWRRAALVIIPVALIAFVALRIWRQRANV